MTEADVVDVVCKDVVEAQHTLTEYLADVTDRVIRETLGGAEAEAKERPVLPNEAGKDIAGRFTAPFDP